MNPTIRSWLAPAYLFLCLVLGGSSQGIWSNALLQICGLAILGFAIWIVPGRKAREQSVLIVLVTALVGLLLLQLLPMPPALWTSLPGRGLVTAGDHLLGFDGQWRPLSVYPFETLSVLPTLIPPVAMLVAILWLESRSAVRMAAAVGVAGLGGIVFGALQVSGHGDRFYWYEISNVGVPTGFFANGNHMAAMLLCLIPIGAAMLERSSVEATEPQQRWVDRLIALSLAFAGIVGLLFNRSLFGLVMAGPVCLASLLIAFRHQIGRSTRLVGAAGALVLAMLLLGMGTFLFASDRATETATSLVTRKEMFGAGWNLLKDNFPAGSGAGTFQRVYAASEDPFRVIHVYVNHAHNDYLEWVVEGGLPGLILLVCFLSWWMRRALAMIADRRADGFAQAGLIIGMILLLHSMIDFPMRTSALAALFAAATGLMLTSRRLPKERADLRPARHLRIG